MYQTVLEFSNSRNPRVAAPKHVAVQAYRDAHLFWWQRNDWPALRPHIV